MTSQLLPLLTLLATSPVSATELPTEEVPAETTAADESSTAPSATAESPAEDELPPLIKEPALIQFVEAPYPPAAETQRVEGTVGLLIEIDETGVVSHVEVDSPAGHGFDEAALEAAKQFVFSPAEDEYGAVPVLIEFAYQHSSFEFPQPQGGLASRPRETPPANPPPPRNPPRESTSATGATSIRAGSPAARILSLAIT